MANTCYSHLSIFTLEGTHRADVGDYVIKGIKGEFYPCKPDIFEMTYDEVSDDDSGGGPPEAVEALGKQLAKVMDETVINMLKETKK